MKNISFINKLAVIGLASAAVVACDDLDTTYQGGYITSGQKQEILDIKPDMAQAGVMGCSSIFSSYMTVYSYHFDFGYPAVMIGLDMQTVDYLCDWVGFNWFVNWQGFTSPTASGTPAAMAWYHLYKQIGTCNTVAKGIAKDTDNDLLKFYRAQAVGTRAFDYLVLAQLFQFNYTNNPDAPGVPLITDENSDEAAINGAPRATLKEMYDQILADLDEAIDKLTSTSYTAEELIESKPKRMISLATAYGLRARANITMGRYTEAAADAQSAISNFTGRPYSRDEVSQPTFTDLDDPSWMWGVAIAETDFVVTSGIVNFPSMTCTFCSSGYTAVGAWKYCSTSMYEGISDTDVRKGWFLDDNLKSANLNKQEQAYCDSYDTMVPGVQVKFAGYQNVVGQSTNASDVPLMRIEEMYYILAESQVRGGNAEGGAQTFIDFVKAYRDPSFEMVDKSAEKVLDAIFKDKIVEFFGEGISYFDYMRLNKGIDRTKTGNCPSQVRYNIPSVLEDPSMKESGVLIYCIPTGEINGNPALTTEDNNMECSKPQPKL